MTPEEVSLLAAELGRTITEDGEVLDEAPEVSLAPPVEATAGSTDDELVFQLGDRRWRVRGLAKATTAGTLRVNLLVSLESGAFHVDTLFWALLLGFTFFFLFRRVARQANAGVPTRFQAAIDSVTRPSTTISASAASAARSFFTSTVGARAAARADPAATSTRRVRMA